MSAPPFKGLYYFYVVANHLSIKQASGELFVTQAAVSQQIRLLEETLGVSLFHRKHRGLSLSDEGARLFPYAKQAFDTLKQGVDQLAADPNPGVLTVTVLPSFASRWLVPRLGRFDDKYPEISVMLQSSDQLQSFDDSHLDLGIRFGRGEYDGLESIFLMNDYIYPVCRPSYQKRHQIYSVDDLKHCKLLVDSLPDMSWSRWFSSLGHKETHFSKQLMYDGAHYVVEAVLAGQGVALLRHSLVADMLASGNLQALFGGPVTLEYQYYACAPKHHFTRPKVRLFIEWLKQEIQQFNSETNIEKTLRLNGA